MTLLRAKRVFTSVLLLIALCLQPLGTFRAQAPAWWAERGLLKPNTSADDHAVLNRGQLKNFARLAAQEMNAELPGGAGQVINDAVTEWLTYPGTDDYAAVNLGQLKFVAAKFYDRFDLPYPWASSPNAADDYALANIGQAKALFALDFSSPILVLLADPMWPVLQDLLDESFLGQLTPAEYAALLDVVQRLTDPAFLALLEAALAQAAPPPGAQPAADAATQAQTPNGEQQIAAATQPVPSAEAQPDTSFLQSWRRVYGFTGIDPSGQTPGFALMQQDPGATIAEYTFDPHMPWDYSELAWEPDVHLFDEGHPLYYDPDYWPDFTEAVGIASGTLLGDLRPLSDYVLGLHTFFLTVDDRFMVRGPESFARSGLSVLQIENSTGLPTNDFETIRAGLTTSANERGGGISAERLRLQWRNKVPVNRTLRKTMLKVKHGYTIGPNDTGLAPSVTPGQYDPSQWHLLPGYAVESVEKVEFVIAPRGTVSTSGGGTVAGILDMTAGPVPDKFTWFTLSAIELRDIKDHANAGDDVTIANWDTTQNITDNNIAWIDAHSSATVVAPGMPQLKLRFPGLGEGVTIEAKLEVQYTRGNGARAARNQPEDTVRIPANGNFARVNGSTWSVYGEADWQTELTLRGFFGGEATLTYRLMNGQNQVLAPQTILFRIGGRNPEPALARQFIETLNNAGPQGALWFAYAIAKSESKDYNGTGTRYNQFYQLPRDANDTHLRVTRRTHAGRPVWGNDGNNDQGVPLPGGYGMFQVTGTVANSEDNIPRSQIWNWQENARAALVILENKRTLADNWMTQQKNANNANGVALPSLTVRNVTFAEGTNRMMNHAVAMKAYNGASKAPTGFTDPDGPAPGFIIDPQTSGHFCYWKNSASGTNKWALSRYNSREFNYVDRVCQEIE